jgi:phosphohistidine phosphatase
MKTLYLARHAKSSWETAGVADADRPVTPKGIKRTNRVVEYLKKRETIADLVVSSPAVRALETAKIVAAGLGYPEDRIRIDRRIYEGHYDRILDLIYETPDTVNVLMVFGHNPTITQVANLFLHPGIEIMPTTGVVCITFDTDSWEQIPVASAISEFFVSPKLLK